MATKARTAHLIVYSVKSMSLYTHLYHTTMNCSRTGAMEDHDSQPSQRRWLPMMMMCPTTGCTFVATVLLPRQTFLNAKRRQNASRNLLLLMPGPEANVQKREIAIAEVREKIVCLERRYFDRELHLGCRPLAANDRIGSLESFSSMLIRFRGYSG